VHSGCYLERAPDWASQMYIFPPSCEEMICMPSYEVRKAMNQADVQWLFNGWLLCSTWQSKKTNVPRHPHSQNILMIVVASVLFPEPASP